MVPCDIEFKIILVISFQRAQKYMVSSGRAVWRLLALIRVIFSTLARQLVRADADGGFVDTACTGGRARVFFVNKAHSLRRAGRIVERGYEAHVGCAMIDEPWLAMSHR